MRAPVRPLHRGFAGPPHSNAHHRGQSGLARTTVNYGAIAASEGAPPAQPYTCSHWFALIPNHAPQRKNYLSPSRARSRSSVGTYPSALLDLCNGSMEHIRNAILSLLLHRFMVRITQNAIPTRGNHNPRGISRLASSWRGSIVCWIMAIITLVVLFLRVSSPN